MDALLDAPAVLSQALVLPNGSRLPNRLVKAAMSEQLATPDLSPSAALVRLYRRWGDSGAGLLITGNVMVDRRAMVEARNEVLEDDSALPRFSEWARAATAGGAHCWLQLNHPGRQTPRKLSPQPVAPSAIGLDVAGLFARPRALTGIEIEDLVRRFARAAGLARRAGFSGVQLHAAHGYLISQFLSPRANRREDAWGGSPEKRRRFLLDIIAACRWEVGLDFTLSVKLNSADFQRGGFTESEALETAAAIAEAGIDVLEVSGGTYESAAMMGTGRRLSTQAREAYFLDFASQVRSRVRIPVLLTGGFRTALGMAGAIASGAVDLVGLGRPLVVDPAFAGRLLRGEASASEARPRRVGIHKLDGMLELYWHGLQLQQLGRGAEPDPRMSLWRAAAYALRENL